SKRGLATVTWKWSPPPVRSTTESSSASGNAASRSCRSGWVAILFHPSQGLSRLEHDADSSSGNLYVLQFATGPGLTGPGVLLRVGSGCSQTPVVTGLMAPGGFVFGPDAAVYI